MTPPFEESYRKLLERAIKKPSEYTQCDCGRTMAVRSKRCLYCSKTFVPVIDQPSDPTYRFIPIWHTNLIAFVSTEDYERISSHRWLSMWSPVGKCWYAVRYEKRINCKRVTILMHREIMGLAPDDPGTVDHAFHNTLDNRRFVDGKENLRLATQSEQLCNQRKRKDNTSGYKGVSWDKQQNKWHAYINIHGVRYTLGFFKNKGAAYKARCEAAMRLHGKFACFG